MSQTSHVPGGRSRATPEDPIWAVLKPSIKVGAACGGAGFVFGGAAGIVKGTTPILFASASGIQTFALGTTFWTCRSIILQAWTPKHQTPSNLAIASAISGGITGGVIAMISRGRSNVLPGAVMFSIFGYLGQTVANRYSNQPVEVESKQGFWRRMADKSFSPVKVMTNEEYAEMLREKMLKIDVEIAVIDDKIEALKREQEGASQQENAHEASRPTTSND